MPTLQEVLRRREPERRSIGRTWINWNALLFFTGRSGGFSSWVRDVTNQGAGIRLERINTLPVDFDLSFDSFRTIRKCRLIWRDNRPTRRARSWACGPARSHIQPCSAHSWIVPALCRYASANPCRVRTALLHHQHRVLLPETNPSGGLGFRIAAAAAFPCVPLPYAQGQL